MDFFNGSSVLEIEDNSLVSNCPTFHEYKLMQHKNGTSIFVVENIVFEHGIFSVQVVGGHLQS